MISLAVKNSKPQFSIQKTKKMNTIKISSTFQKLLGDTYTPVGMYLKLRDQFPNSILLESSDYHGDEHSYSYICCEPYSKFVVDNNEISYTYPDGSTDLVPIKERTDVIAALDAYREKFDYDKLDLPFMYNGLFGYTSYNAVQYFEDVEIQDFENESREIPEMIYQTYRFVLAFNHFNNELFVIEHLAEGVETKMDEMVTFLKKRSFATYDFKASGVETSNYTDEEYAAMVEKGIAHCHRGDVFQIVVSRRFERTFEGDDFNVYRALRSINPSPYLFFFDFGGFKIMGSSPEAQIIVNKGKATIHPIAGTFKRTGNDREDYDLAKKLFDDPKETSEHVMLVDLARNDLSRHGSKVTVDVFKEIQYYSHVIHMVSKVSATLDEGASPLQLVADTFPAGTLSGAPKHMAMSLINKYEKSSRGYYGGAIGHIDFNGDFNHAIMIRTMLSKNNTLFYQAGAGVVAKSVVASEVQEVKNKLMALNIAIEKANEV